MRKKILSLIIICCMMITMLSGTIVYANTENESSNDIVAKSIFEHSTFIGKDNQGNFIFESEYTPSVSPLTAENHLASKTTFTIVPENSEDEAAWNNLITRRASYSSYGEQWDASKSCKIYCTIYYTKNGNSAYMNYISGGYTKSDSSISVTQQQVYYTSGQNNGQINTTYQGSSSSWTVYPPSSWSPINTDVVHGMIACTLTTTVKRSASPWTITLSNTALFTGY